MYVYQINEMVECLVASGAVESAKVAAAQKTLCNYWTGKIALIWNPKNNDTALLKNPLYT